MQRADELRLPMEPLERLVATRQVMLQQWGAKDERMFHRCRRRGYILERAADHLCIKHLDIQPELLWPELTR